MFPRTLVFTVLIALIITSATRGEPIAPNRSEPDYKPKDLGHLQFYRTVTLRGVLTFEHHRKLEPPPEVRYSALRADDAWRLQCQLPNESKRDLLSRWPR